MSKLNSSHLALLTEIERTGSLARAALALGISAPAVSQQLSRLEKDLGAVCVERGARGARLTALGRRLAEHGIRISQELEAAEQSTAEFLGTHANRLRIGAPPSLSIALLPAAIAAIRYRHPGAELSVVDVMSDEGSELVATGHLDLALCADYVGAVADDRVASHHLARDLLEVLIPDDHAWAAAGAEPALELRVLAEEDWVSGPRGRPSRSQLDEVAAESGFIPRVPFETESYDVMQALVDAGVAVALVPHSAVRERPTIVSKPFARPLWREIRAVVASSSEHVPLAHELLGHLFAATASGRIPNH